MEVLLGSISADFLPLKTKYLELPLKKNFEELAIQLWLNIPLPVYIDPNYEKLPEPLT